MWRIADCAPRLCQVVKTQRVMLKQGKLELEVSAADQPRALNTSESLQPGSSRAEFRDPPGTRNFKSLLGSCDTRHFVSKTLEA